jgi:glycogen phosphorylase
VGRPIQPGIQPGNFNQGDYIGAVQSKVLSENISKVLYPSDEKAIRQGAAPQAAVLFVAATLNDILRRYRKIQRSFADLPNFVAIQLNDTHPPSPSRADAHFDGRGGAGLGRSLAICEQTFAYTNHTVLPEALETWPVELLGRLLPRHLQIIYEINHRFLESVRSRHPDDQGLPGRVSLISEGRTRHVRMAHLAIVGSHTVNGVAALHGEIIKHHLFKDFHHLFPRRIRHVTNGITPRRWLKQPTRFWPT